MYNLKKWKEKEGVFVMENDQWVKETLKEKNIDLIGFADLSEIDTEKRYDYPHAICFAVALKVFPSTDSELAKEYYDEFNAVNQRLRETSNFLVEKIMERGFNAYSLFEERQNETFRTQLPLKTLATRSGLGWIGKPAILVTKEYGSAVRISGVLTDMPLTSGTPINESLCGSCEECVKHCPGHAIKGNIWSVHMDRDNLVDPFRCIDTIIERGRVFNVMEGECDICISVCPWTKRYKSGTGELK